MSRAEPELPGWDGVKRSPPTPHITRGGSVKPTYTVLDVQAEEQPVEERRRAEEHNAGQEREKRMRVAGCYCLSALLRRPSSLRPASTETRVHAVAHTHTHAPRRTHPTHLPPAHAFLILLPLLVAEAFCSLLFPFSLSLSAPPFPFFNILFLSLHMQLASPSLPPPSLPSLPPLPSRSRSLSLHLLSLSSVRAEREAII